MFIYNIGIYLYVILVKIASLFNPKAKLWVNGRRGWKSRLAAAFVPGDRVVWVHSASLGEFEQGRPIIEAIRAEHPEYKILLTFFSPSGYEIRKNYTGVDYVCYLPADTPANVKQFLSTVRPEIAIFIKYDFWLNYLSGLNKMGSRIFVVSSIFRRNSVFFKWYGGAFRRVLGYFEQLFVQNEESQRLLAEIGIDKVTRAGDTRFDRVASIALSSKKIDLVERFAADSSVFVAGSTWPADETIIEQLIKNRPDLKFIIAPHEIESDRIDAMISRIEGRVVRYMQCAADTDVDRARVMFIDTIGILSSVYRYADYAYIGGGFGVGIHNTLEAATFGLPVAFGPNYAKFREAREMIALGTAHSIADYDALAVWVDGLCRDKQHYNKIRGMAAGYIKQNRGATEIIMNRVFGKQA